MQRQALKSLLEALQDANLIYRWNFPFHLSVTKYGQQFSLRNKDDLPQFLKHPNLPTIDIPDWRSSLRFHFHLVHSLGNPLDAEAVTGIEGALLVRHHRFHIPLLLGWCKLSRHYQVLKSCCPFLRNYLPQFAAVVICLNFNLLLLQFALIQ